MMDTRAPGDNGRNWTVDEIRVLVAIYFNASFSIGDDARDECRAIADCFGRTASSIDRQWRNVAAVEKGKRHYNVGGPVKVSVADYLANPAGSKALALQICERQGWPLQTLIREGTQPPLLATATTDSEGDLRDAFRRLCDRMEYKVFNSGSQGFYCQGKIRLSDGSRYQAQATAVLIGSKNDALVAMSSSSEQVAFSVAAILEGVAPKTFRTGRVGFYGSGKIRVGEERFQVGLQAVQIGEP